MNEDEDYKAISRAMAEGRAQYKIYTEPDGTVVADITELPPIKPPPPLSEEQRAALINKMIQDLKTVRDGASS